MTAAAFYTLENGARELLQVLYESMVDEAKTNRSVPMYLSDSRRENRIEANAEPVEHNGISLHNWVIGANKTHITPIDAVDECV